MPAVFADTLTLPRLAPIDITAAAPRRIAAIIDAPRRLEGDGFVVRRPFPSADLRMADPFLLLDHMGAVDYAPGEAKGASAHPHRGFETVTYLVEGAMEHRDSTGGGGVIRDGATQWMTAGSGIVHSELPTEELVVKGGQFHGVQLWVNLPASEKWTTPTYQNIEPGAVSLVSSQDGTALLRIIAGKIGEFGGPGSTRTPIVYAHATLFGGSKLDVDWRRDFNALVYVLDGEIRVGAENAALREGQLAVLQEGDYLSLTATSRANILLLGGRPINEPVVFYGPFVMNTEAEIHQAIADYRAGTMGEIPPLTTA